MSVASSDWTVDGFTCGMSVTPKHTACDTISCTPPAYIGISTSSNQCQLDCPVSNLVLKNGAQDTAFDLDQIIGCLSDCSRYGRDRACCTGNYSNPNTCPATNPWFRKACPAAYSYAFDDDATHFCSATDSVTIVFKC
jgi:hypothetical protein